MGKVDFGHVNVFFFFLGSVSNYKGLGGERVESQTVGHFIYKI